MHVCYWSSVVYRQPVGGDLFWVCTRVDVSRWNAWRRSTQSTWPRTAASPWPGSPLETWLTWHMASTLWPSNGHLGVARSRRRNSREQGKSRKNEQYHLLTYLILYLVNPNIDLSALDFIIMGTFVLRLIRMFNRFLAHLPGKVRGHYVHFSFWKRSLTLLCLALRLLRFCEYWLCRWSKCLMHE